MPDTGVASKHGNVVLQKQAASHTATSAKWEAGSAIIAKENGPLNFQLGCEGAFVSDGFIILQKQAVLDGHVRVPAVDAVQAVLQSLTNQIFHHNRNATAQKPHSCD